MINKISCIKWKYVNNNLSYNLMKSIEHISEVIFKWIV